MNPTKPAQKNEAPIPGGLTRRRLIQSTGAVLALSAASGLLACSSEDGSAGGSGGADVLGTGDGLDAQLSDSTGADATGDARTESSPEGTSTPETAADGIDDEAGADASPDETLDGADDSTEAEAADAPDEEIQESGWASGGTEAMSGDYPDPFTGGDGDPCELFCAATLGPCYATSPERKDISEGELGLPMRMAFRVVNEACEPIPDASVDVWHTSATGFYSSNEAADMCTLGNPEAVASRWFRGYGRTDADGRVDFDSCYPGWYPGRTIHIHFTVRVGGEVFVTSQLYWDDALSDEILPTQPIYKDRGERDTDNTSDGIIPKVNQDKVLFHTERLPDGALMSWKTLVIRDDLSDPLC